MSRTGVAPRGTARRARGPALALATAAALAVALLLGACNIATARLTRTDHQAFSIAAGAQTDLAVSTFNGNITVTAQGEGTADVTVTSFGSGPTQDIARSALDSVAVSITQAGGTVNATVTPTGDGPLGGGRGADVDVTLPAESSVVLVSSNGRIEAVNVNGSIAAITSNGAIITRAGHDLHLETSNGSLTLTDPAGTVSGRTSNAAVDILNANAVVADVQTSSGSISFSGSLAAGLQSFRTGNASVSLRLPSSQGFSVAGQTSNASVTTDFPGLTVNGVSLSGSTGDGSAQVSVATSNGALSVTRLTP